MTPEEWQAYKRRQYCRERRDERFRVKLALETINSDAADAFYRNIDANLFPWSSFFREVVKARPRMSADIQTVLLGRWVEHKSIASYCDHSPISALRMLLPSYDGSAMRLFRGAGIAEYEEGRYQLSWTSDFPKAEDFANDKSQLPGGSLVLETLAPPEAILCDFDKALPFDHQGFVELKRRYQNVHNER